MEKLFNTTNTKRVKMQKTGQHQSRTKQNAEKMPDHWIGAAEWSESRLNIWGRQRLTRRWQRKNSVRLYAVVCVCAQL